MLDISFQPNVNVVNEASFATTEQDYHVQLDFTVVGAKVTAKRVHLVLLIDIRNLPIASTVIRDTTAAAQLKSLFHVQQELSILTLEQWNVRDVLVVITALKGQ